MGTTGRVRRSDADDVLTHRVLELLPDPAAARSSRRMLRDLLDSTGHREWTEPAELACTELVTNAVLHAHTTVTVTVVVRPDELYVAVSDASHDLPQQRAGDAQATTGRGMLLVARLVTEHGVRRDETGKTVWFTVRTSPASPTGEETSEDDLLSMWGDDTADDLEASSAAPAGQVGTRLAPAVGGSTRVLLVRLPPTLWLAAAEHHQTVLRELVLYVAEHHDAAVDMAPVDTARTLLDGAVGTAVEQARREGTARRPLPDDHPGELPWVPESVMMTLDVPVDVGPHFAALQDALDLAERLATAGQLLARPGLPEVVALRDWACEQVIAQLGGAPAAPWPGTDHEQFLTQEALHDGTAGWDVDVVRSTLRPVVAADDSNRIVAVSSAMAAVVGWEVDDLVGRRVVTLIPPRLREGHVAGFSRHLSTGEARLLGVPLELPVLRADGTEVRCGVLIEEAAADHGRRLYLAWFDPLQAADPDLPRKQDQRG